MRVKIIFLLGLLIFSSQLVFGKEPEWLKKMKSLTLLSSTRDQVIKIFGQPENDNRSYLENFVLEDGRISVQYSTGKCKTTIIDGKEVKQGWNVPEWTVVNVYFSPNKRFKPEKLKISFTGFRSYPISDVPNAVVYENDELGVDYSLTKGKIEFITFRPPEKLSYLHCE